MVILKGDDILKIDVIQNNVKSEVETVLFYLDEFICNNNDELINNYRMQFLNLFSELNKYCKDNDAATNILTIVLSRVTIEMGEFTYPTFLYGEKLYLDLIYEGTKIDFSDILKFFIECKDNCVLQNKKYYQIYNSALIKQEVYKYLKYFNFYIVKILREIFISTEIVNSINGIFDKKKFIVIENEFYEKPYLIWEN